MVLSSHEEGQRLDTSRVGKAEATHMGCVIETHSQPETKWDKSPEQGDQQPCAEAGLGEVTAWLAAAKSPEIEPFSGLKGSHCCLGGVLQDRGVKTHKQQS